jgi:hypothetical protein
MKKKKGTFKNSLFFLVGALTYSFLYWITAHNYAHVFGIILIVLACFILKKMEKNQSPEWLKTESLICMSAGVIFDSLSSGFPFGFLH